MAGYWTLQIGELMDTISILVLVLTGIMIVIIISLHGSNKGHFLYEFKKSRSPTFDGYLKKSEDEKDWLLGMKKLFELHEYTKDMKEKIAIFSLKEKEHV